MMRQLTVSELLTLESFIDDAGLWGVLDALADISAEKASHIRESYGQDDATAKRWEGYVSRLRHVSASFETR